MYNFGYKNQIINIQGVSMTQEDENGAKKVRVGFNNRLACGWKVEFENREIGKLSNFKGEVSNFILSYFSVVPKFGPKYM